MSCQTFNNSYRVPCLILSLSVFSGRQITFDNNKKLSVLIINNGPVVIDVFSLPLTQSQLNYFLVRPSPPVLAVITVCSVEVRWEMVCCWCCCQRLTAAGQLIPPDHLTEQERNITSPVVNTGRRSTKLDNEPPDFLNNSSFLKDIFLYWNIFLLWNV